jgi:hypothetical protein
MIWTHNLLIDFDKGKWYIKRTYRNKGNRKMIFVKMGVSTYVAIALKGGLNMYMSSGMKPNRAWTPTAMLAAASEITG